MLLWRNVASGSGTLYFLSMLVSTCEKKCLITDHLVKTGQDIGEYGSVGMSDMRGVVNVINRSGDVKIFHERTSLVA